MENGHLGGLHRVGQRKGQSVFVLMKSTFTSLLSLLFAGIGALLGLIPLKNELPADGSTEASPPRPPAGEAVASLDRSPKLATVNPTTPNEAMDNAEKPPPTSHVGPADDNGSNPNSKIIKLTRSNARLVHQLADAERSSKSAKKLLWLVQEFLIDLLDANSSRMDMLDALDSIEAATTDDLGDVSANLVKHLETLVDRLTTQ